LGICGRSLWKEKAWTGLGTGPDLQSAPAGSGRQRQAINALIFERRVEAAF
jgi:hypothetical protein